MQAVSLWPLPRHQLQRDVRLLAALGICLVACWLSNEVQVGLMLLGLRECI